MSNMSFRNFNSKSDGLRFDFSTNKLKYSSLLSTSESRSGLRSRVLRDSARRLLGVFIRPPAHFGKSFASPVLEKSRFFLLRPNFPASTAHSNDATWEQLSPRSTIQSQCAARTFPSLWLIIQGVGGLSDIRI